MSDNWKTLDECYKEAGEKFPFYVKDNSRDSGIYHRIIGTSWASRLYISEEHGVISGALHYLQPENRDFKLYIPPKPKVKRAEHGKWIESIGVFSSTGHWYTEEQAKKVSEDINEDLIPISEWREFDQ